MKLQSLNHLFGKAVAALAIAFTILAPSAQAKDQPWESFFAGDCLYITVYNRKIPVSQPGYAQQYRIGCTVKDAAGREFFHDEVNNVWSPSNTNRFYRLTAQGWMEVGQQPSAYEQVVRQVLGPDAVQPAKPDPNGCDYDCVQAMIAGSRERQREIWSAPACVNSSGGCRP